MSPFRILSRRFFFWVVVALRHFFRRLLTHEINEALTALKGDVRQRAEATVEFFEFFAGLRNILKKIPGLSSVNYESMRWISNQQPFECPLFEIVQANTFAIFAGNL